MGSRERVARGVAPARFSVASPYVARWLFMELTNRKFDGATVRSHAQWLREARRRPDLAGQVEMWWAQLQEAVLEHNEASRGEDACPRPALVVSDNGSAQAEIGEVGGESAVKAELTTKEAAEMLGLKSERRVLQLRAAGDLSGRKVGRSWLLDRVSVEALRDVRSAS